ncbi:MAG TPA: DUF1064 domain-containing protein [Flavisolibacter sp.]|nr:DUF1064 domain-containing protein [Flavisolibacter sp.]
MTAAEYQAYLKAQAKTGKKFGNKPVTVDGIYFQSTWEAEYYGQCKMEIKAGLLKAVHCQYTFKFIVNGILITTYRADFVRVYPDGRKEVIDTKSDVTEILPEFKIKGQLMKAIYNIPVIVKKKGK